MKYTNLGRTGVQVSRLCLGCMNFGGRTQTKETIQIIDHAIAEGINLPTVINLIWRVRRHKAVHSHRFSCLLPTKDQASSISSTSSASAGTNVYSRDGCCSTSSSNQFITVRRQTPKMRSMPRKLHRSRYACNTCFLT